MVVCYTGGGTLGHIYPALAVHQQLMDQPHYEGFFIGRREEGERNAVERAGLTFYGIAAGRLRRYRTWRNLTDWILVLAGFFQALWILFRQRPQIIFSKGGFVTPPVVLAAYVLRIPVVSHESDATPGLATRINSRFSTLLCTGFEQVGENLGAREVIVTGNPVRRELLEGVNTAQIIAGIGDGERLILVLGGSQGSVQINTLVRQSLDQLTALGWVYHQCGVGGLNGSVSEQYIEVEQITDLLPALLKRADLVISRSGAGIISELALYGKPALLIPLSAQQSRGDQIDNASYLAQRGAARVLLGEIDRRDMVNEVDSMLADQKALTAMAEAMGALARPESAQAIARLITERRKG